MTTIAKWCAAGLTACIWSLSFNALADDSAVLKKKLASIRQFSAHFEQTVTDAQGKPLQNGSGEMVLQRPDHFRWEAKKPDDNLILSDGKAVWLYDPFVEQVTVMSLSKAVVNTPFLLISSSDDKIWKNYLIDQDGSAFTITSKQKDQRIESLRMVFDNQNHITRMEVSEAQGQRSEFTLSAFNANPTIKADTFNFKTPEGVTVDDQR
ncbi:MAG: outer membrane lipoprotein chaperone LolA [Tolumonas sp.]|uniref:outer membrane lipoprotein chaperone LolA n=1 Tax=uncultured Tolumonas sp. TaxID=263765 RepID=UPI002A0A199D|nr:outer membrane lipoprotein chaperone LolA [uncultured Tolumonas sp.]MDD2341854.1 outer membrane lipoprotein chaperone LolA [Tolumonas sp.]